MHNLAGLLTLPALFFSKIFDQVGGNDQHSGYSILKPKTSIVDIDFQTQELGLEDWYLVPPPPSIIFSPTLWCSDTVADTCILYTYHPQAHTLKPNYANIRFYAKVSYHSQAHSVKLNYANTCLYAKVYDKKEEWNCRKYLASLACCSTLVCNCRAPSVMLSGAVFSNQSA